MTDRELEQKLCDAVHHAAPDDLDRVLSRCKDRKGNVIDMTEKMTIKSRRFVPWLAAACMLLVIGVVGFQFQQLSAVASVVSLDVNPSVELRVNKKEKVLEARAVNLDGEEILDGMDLKGTNLNVAVNAIVGSLLKHGYVDELANSVLITVEDSNAARGAALQQSLANEVDAILANASLHGAILSQTVDTGDSTLQQKADQYGITLGKATLIQSMVDQNSQFTFEELAPLSVNELNLLASNPKNLPAAVASTGTASDDAYIGVEKAKEAAFRHAKVSAADVTMGGVDFDYENGRMVYELEFYANNTEYEYDVDAATGDIVKYSSEGGSNGDTPAGQDDIGSQKAKSIALKHAGFSESQVTGLRVEKDWDDGRLEYSVEFWADGVEYDYEIAGADGSILSYDNDREDDWDDDKDAISSSGSAGQDDIGSKKAKSIALKHAGFSESQVTGLRVEKDWDDGRLEYSVEFWADGVEYDYEIAGADGSILSYDNDREDDWDDDKDTVSSSGSAGQDDIGSKKAKSIALKHAGFSESQVTGLRVEKDWDDGRLEYSVEFWADGVEYDYEIAGADGSILSHDQDRDD